MRKIILLFTLSVCASNSHAQEVPVDLNTGTPVISIQLWTVSAHDLSHSVGIYYDPSGLRLEQTPEFVGLGWRLSGISKISREVRGLPDDFTPVRDGKISFDERRGWLRPMEGSTTLPAKSVGDFIPTSDLNGGSPCGDELADFNTLTNYKFIDTEPDIFHYSAGSISGSFVFDNSENPQIRLIPYQDVKIDYKVSLRTKDIISFTVTDNRGTVYFFDRPVKEEDSFRSLAENQYFVRDRTLHSYEITEPSYEMPESYMIGGVTYNTQWMLTKIKSVTGSEVEFEYTQNDFAPADTVNTGIRSDTINEIISHPAYETYQKYEEQRINLIKTSTGEQIKFHYEDSLVSLIQVLDGRRAENKLVKEFAFDHRLVLNDHDPEAKRKFLASVTERSEGMELPAHKFNYIGVNFESNRTTLPSHYSKAKDFWGYYNGKTNNESLYPSLYVYPALGYPEKVRVSPIPGYSGEEIALPGANRFPDPAMMEIGTLNQIQYPLGGYLHINYESGTYYDPASAQTWLGGGLRVRSLTFFDGMNADAMVYKEFNYEEAPGISSGRLLANPVFYIPQANYFFLDSVEVHRSYSSLLSDFPDELWDRLLVRSEENLAEWSGVSYKKVTVKIPGSGRSVYEFDTPAMSGTLSSGDWVATDVRIARNSCEETGILDTGGPWRFPFVPNPNFQHERGQLLRKAEYDEQGVLVKETTSTYQYLYKQGTAPSKVWGLRFEHYPRSSSVFLFGKYFLLTDVAKVPAEKTVKVYDEQNPARFVERKTEYLYQGTAHKLLTGTTTTNSDGTLYRRTIKYPLDYGTIPATTDKAASMISKLQTDFRNGTPIERYSTIQKPGDTEKVVGASLLKFNDFGTANALPEYTLALTAESPLSDFTPASIQLVNGQQTFVSDPRYETVTQIQAYESAYSIPKTVKNLITGTVSGTIWGYNGTLPVADITHATPDQIAFSDFETSSSASFSVSAETIGAGHTGNRSILPSATLSRTIEKASVNNYTLSLWVKTDGTPIDIALTLKNADGTSTYQSISFTANSQTPGKFFHVSRQVPVSMIPDGVSFQVMLTGQIPSGSYTSSPSLMPVMDDVAFYPEGAVLTSSTFNIPYGNTSVTDYTGLSSYQDYDALGRTKLLKDKDKNIVGKNTYTFSSAPDILASGFVVFDPDDAVPLDVLLTNVIYISANSTLRFVANEDTHENVTYEWDFGTGFTAGSRIAEHSFTQGTHSVSLRVSKQGYATVTGNAKQVIAVLPLTICAEGVKTYNASTNVSTETFPDCNLISGTTPAFTTAFKVDDTGLFPAGTIQWKIRDAGSDRWIKSQGATNQIQITGIDERSTGFEMICEVWDGPTMKAQSNIIHVSVVH